MRIELFGTKIYVSFLFAATISFMLATDRTGLVIPTLFAAMIHEFGHLFAMWVNGCAPKEIKLVPAAVEIVEGYPKTERSQLWIIICGPLSNIAVSAALLINFYLSQSDISLKYGLLNAVLAVFNMLPVSGLDGGRLLTLLIARKSNLFSAVRAVRIITVVFSVIAFLSGVILIINGKLNLSVFIVAIYLAICAAMKQ